jgi:hypothetical protein
MQKLIERAAARIKTMADQIESTRKGVTYRADVAAKNVIKIVKGIFNGQSRP